MKYSLFIGRYQPLHEGHKKLIQTVIDEGKTPLIALRDTEIDEKNPYSVSTRMAMFNVEYGDKVKVITIPDIEEVCYGRDVGYGVRQIDLDEKTKGISATKIRNGKVWWITGNSGSGKTTLALNMKDVIILDGDDLRRCWSLGFTKEDRWEQNLRAAKLAKLIKDQGKQVVVSTICPYKKLREEVKAICDCKFVYLDGGKKSNKEFPYEK